MEFYVGKKGEKLGPFTDYAIRLEIEQGEISGDDLGWTRGMEKWIPLREIEALKSIVEAAERVDADDDDFEAEPGLNLPTAEELGYPKGPNSDPPPIPAPSPTAGPVAAARMAEIEAIAQRVNPFRRFFARVLDYLFVSLVTMAIYRPQIPAQEGDFSEFWKQWTEFSTSPEGTTFGIISLVSLLIWVPIEALLLSMFGSTPGKAVFGLAVLDSTGRPPQWWTAFARSLAVWLVGYGAGIFWISIPLMIVAFFQLLTRGATFWDRYYGTEVARQPFSVTRILLAVFLFLSLLGLSHLATLPK